MITFCDEDQTRLVCELSMLPQPGERPTGVPPDLPVGLT
jgi:hypothetical protein